MDITYRIFVLFVFFTSSIAICGIIIEKKNSWRLFFTVIQFLAGLCIVYLAIYVFFYYNLGFPSGDLIDEGDWLSFLSGYLGFAGSIIMAWLVFKQSADINKQTTVLNEQSKIINQFTLLEYHVMLVGIINELEIIKEYSETDRKNWVRIANDLEFFKYELSKESSEDNPDFGYRYALYFKLYNMSKIAINNLRFNAIQLIELDNDMVVTSFTIDTRDGSDAFNGTHTIIPNDWLPICFILPSISNYPDKHSCRMEISFSSKEVISDAFSFVLYREGNTLTLVDKKRYYSI